MCNVWLEDTGMNINRNLSVKESAPTTEQSFVAADDDRNNLPEETISVPIFRCSLER